MVFKASMSSYLSPNRALVPLESPGELLQSADAQALLQTSSIRISG